MVTVAAPVPEVQITEASEPLIIKQFICLSGNVTVLVVPGDPVNLITACLPLLSAVPSAKANVTLPEATLTSTYPPIASSNKSIRFSLSVYNKKEEIDLAVNEIVNLLNQNLNSKLRLNILGVR